MTGDRRTARRCAPGRRSPIWSPGSTARSASAPRWSRRGRTGAGETVGSSLNNGLISLLAFLAANYLATGEVPARTGNDHAIVSPYGMFRTADGEVALAPSQEQSYQRLVDALGAPNCATTRVSRPTTCASPTAPR